MLASRITTVTAVTQVPTVDLTAPAVSVAAFGSADDSPKRVFMIFLRFRKFGG
jgi:hypothetical protein